MEDGPSVPGTYKYHVCSPAGPNTWILKGPDSPINQLIVSLSSTAPFFFKKSLAHTDPGIGETLPDPRVPRSQGFLKTMRVTLAKVKRIRGSQQGLSPQGRKLVGFPPLQGAFNPLIPWQPNQSCGAQDFDNQLIFGPCQPGPTIS